MALLLAAVTVPAQADLQLRGVGYTGEGASGLVACATGGLDFSVSTGCGLTFYMVGMR